MVLSLFITNYSVFSDKINRSADVTSVAEPLAAEKLTSNVKSASSSEVEFTVLCSLKAAHEYLIYRQ